MAKIEIDLSDLPPALLQTARNYASEDAWLIDGLMYLRSAAMLRMAPGGDGLEHSRVNAALLLVMLSDVLNAHSAARVLPPARVPVPVPVTRTRKRPPLGENVVRLVDFRKDGGRHNG